MSKIKYLVMDVDGTLTDGKIYMGDSGEVFKAFDIKDGYGIHSILPENNITPIIITGRQSKIVENRCEELGVGLVFQNVNNKIMQLKQIVNDLSLVSYIGDDINDLPVIEAVNKAGGLTGAPNNANERIKGCVAYVSSCNGGDGAVRDFIEWIVMNNTEQH